MQEPPWNDPCHAWKASRRNEPMEEFRLLLEGLSRWFVPEGRLKCSFS